MQSKKDLFAPPTEAELSAVDMFAPPTELELLLEPEGVSQTESALRGAAQEATFGLADELTGIAETGLETVKGNVPLSASELLKSYQKLRDESRAAYKSAEEANPASYLGGQLVGGIAPAFVTGGTSVAAKLAAGAAKPALASLIKQGAVSGLKYGAAQGVGKSEAEVAEGEFGKLGKDIAAESILGGAAGAAMPLAAPAIKGATKSLSKGAKAVADLRKKLPGYDKAVTAFKWGEMGKDLSVEAVDPELQKFGAELYKKITDTKGNVNTKKAVEALEAMGVKVDTKEAVDAAIADIKKIASSGAFETGKAAEILEELRKLRGDDLQAEKLIDKLEKRVISKSVKDSTKAEQAIIKGEKKLMDQSLKTGDEIDTIMDLNRKFEDIAEIPTTTSEGTIGGVRGKLQRTAIDPETGEEILETYSRDLTSDITPYQPTAPQVQIDPTTGRPIAISKDLGTGKIDAIVGDVLNDVPVDPSKIPLSEIDDLVSKINSYTNIAKTQGASSDPAVRRLQTFAGELRKLQNKAIEESGLAPDLISSRKQMSNILEAEKIIGIDGRESLIKDIDSAQKAKELADFFGFEKGFKGREERRMAEDLLSSTMDSKSKETAQLLRDVNSIIGRTGDSVSGDTISRSSLFQQMVTKAPNLAGQGKKAMSEAILNTSKAIQNATPNEIKQLAQRFAASSQKAAQTYAPMIEQAIGPNGQVRKSALFALYQQPAFRELMRSSDIVGQGADQSPLSQLSNPTPPNSNQSSTYVPPTENEDDQVDLDKEYANIIGSRESSNNYKAVNQLGYLGKYQFGGSALQDLKYKDSKGKWTGKDGIRSTQDFLNNPKIQEKAFSEWGNILDRYAKSKGLDKYIGSDFKGVKITKRGIRAASHLVGSGALSKMFKTGKVPKDANGVKATEYLKMFEKDDN
jgi:hypothetical protein